MILVDTPGFNDTKGIENMVANDIGITKLF